MQKEVLFDIHDRFIRDEKFHKNMFDIGRTEEMCRKIDELANEDHTHHQTPEENSRIQSQLVDSFKQSRFRFDASPASTWLQASIVNFATVQTPRECCSSAKIDAKLFFVLVELARNLVAFFLSGSPWRRTQHWYCTGKFDRKVIGPLNRGMILTDGCITTKLPKQKM